jgi:hypothetical protein
MNCAEVWFRCGLLSRVGKNSAPSNNLAGDLRYALGRICCRFAQRALGKRGGFIEAMLLQQLREVGRDAYFQSAVKMLNS